jgi:hypothetical protein
MSLDLHLKIVGASLLLLGGLHGLFPWRFHWRQELGRLSLLNRQIFIVHCLFIVLTLWMMGILALAFTDRLLDPTPLATPILAGLALFWLLRLVVQWAVYDHALWRGDRFNTLVHLAFTALWSYYALVFGAALWQMSAAHIR